MIEVLHSGNAPLDGIVHSGQKFSKHELGVGDMTGVEHSGMRFTKKRLGILRQDLSEEDIAPNVADPLKRKKPLFIRRFIKAKTPKEQKVQGAQAEPELKKQSENTDTPPSAFDLDQDTGRLGWQKEPSTYGIHKRYRPEELGIIDHKNQKKRLKRKAKWGLAMLSLGIPGFLWGSHTADSSHQNTRSGKIRGTEGAMGALGSLCLSGSALILLSETSFDYIRTIRQRKANSKTKYSSREIKVLTSHETQQHPLSRHTTLLAEEPYLPNKVGVWDVETTRGNPAKVTVLVFDGKKKHLHR